MNRSVRCDCLYQCYCHIHGLRSCHSHHVRKAHCGCSEAKVSKFKNQFVVKNKLCSKSLWYRSRVDEVHEHFKVLTENLLALWNLYIKYNLVELVSKYLNKL